MLKDELDFFIRNQDRLVKLYPGKVLVIKQEEVVGAYQTPLEAYLEAKKEHEPGTFMIQPCEPGPGAYTLTIATHGLVQ